MIRRLVFLLPAFVAATAAVAGLFGSSTPSESDAERLWVSRFNNSNGLLKMTSFKKTDGKTIGNSGYSLYYALTYTVTDDCQYDSEFRATRELPRSAMDELIAGAGEKIRGYKGQEITQSGEMLYEKRESGWQFLGTENVRVSESPETAKRRANDEEARRQEALRQQRERKDRKEALIAKSKEQHRTIKTVVVKGERNPVDGAFAPPGQLKIVLNDSNLTFINWRGTHVVWFGDIRRIFPLIGGQDAQLKIEGPNTNDPYILFASPEELNNFFQSCVAAIEEWRKDNSALFEK
jgi:hypothetical protein